MRRLLFALAGVLTFATPAFAAEPQNPGAGRYALQPSRDGFVRLDTETGAVSHCGQQEGVWRCEPLTADDAAVQAKIDALTAQVAKLSAALAEMTARVETLRAKTVGPAVASHSEGVAQKAVHRFLALIRALKHREDSPT